MKKLLVFLSILFCSTAVAAHGAADWSAVANVFGKKGTVQGDVFKVTFPRSDLKVTIGNVQVEPGLALTSWIGFKSMGRQAAIMGDLVLLDTEYGPVLAKLVSEGIEVTALHNHLVGETPRILYMHFSGSGTPVKLAESMKAAISLTGTPLQLQISSPASSEPDWSKVESVLGKKGQHKGNLFQVTFPLSENIMEGKMELPPAMGVATSINIQMAGDKAAATGDFVLLAKEVNPVVKALTEHGIAVTALHSHMLTESPRLFFLHFWAVDSPERIAEGLKAALDNTNIKRR